MTTPTIEPATVFADAREMHVAALERLEQGDIRDAAEKAWCAAKRATDALILDRTGVLPPRSPDTTRGLRTLAAADPAFPQPARPLLFTSGGAARRLFLHRMV